MTTLQIIEKATLRDLDPIEIKQLLEIQPATPEFYALLASADTMCRKMHNNKAYIFSQIGLNAAPCSANCKFCSMAKSHYCMDTTFEKNSKNLKELQELVSELVNQGTHDIFLMTTADYPLEEYLKIGQGIRSILPNHVRLVANIGDFTEDTAKQLLLAGFTGVYHICRLREGIDTDVTVETRIKTLDCIHESELELYYCIEPIGPEHTYDEIIVEMLRAKEYKVEAMAVMKRTPIPNTPLEHLGSVSSLEMIKIAAVTRLVVKPTRSMNVHETTPMSLLAGINQLYAEVGANPRDQVENTANSRGYDVATTINLFEDAEYRVPTEQ